MWMQLGEAKRARGVLLPGVELGIHGGRARTAHILLEIAVALTGQKRNFDAPSRLMICVQLVGALTKDDEQNLHHGGSVTYTLLM